MRSVVSAFMTLLLVTLVTVCPLMSCAADADSSLNHACCHKLWDGMPCAPKTKVQQCTYSLLERSTPAAAATAAVPAVVTLVAEVPEDSPIAPLAADRRDDSRDLHQRIHVLRI
jgi:hypothetical protein